MPVSHLSAQVAAAPGGALTRHDRIPTSLLLPAPMPDVAAACPPTMSARADRFWRQVGAVLGGTAFAQSIPLLGSLLIARLYVPSEFGIFAAWLGASQLAAVAATGRYEVALALEPDGPARAVAMRATLVMLCISALPLAFLAWAAGFFAPVAAVPPALRWLFVPTVLAIAASQAWLAWAAAEGRLTELSRQRIAQAAAVTGAQIAAGALWPSAVALALAQLAGIALALAVAARGMPLARAETAPDPSSQRAAMRAFWVRRRSFPFLSLPADAINATAAQMPLLIIGARFGAEVAGHLALTLRVLAAPVALLGSAVLDVFKRRSAQSWRERGHCRDEYLQTFRVLATGSVVAAIALAATSEWLFATAFGEPWRAAGTIALWLLPLFALRFVASPLSYIFYVAGKQRADLVWQALLLAMTAATLSLPGTARGALLAYAAGYSAMYGLYLWLSWRFAQGAHAHGRPA